MPLCSLRKTSHSAVNPAALSATACLALVLHAPTVWGQANTGARADSSEGAVAPAAPAEEAFPLEVTASAFSRFELREGYDRMGVSRGRFQEGDTTVYRARLGLRTRPVELGHGLEASLQFTPQASGQYGKVQTIGEQSLGLYEGYVRLQGLATTFDVGRFQLDYGEALVLGNLDWHQSGRAFEGLRVRQLLEAGWIDAFVTQTPRLGETTAEGHPAVNRPLFGGDTYLWGVYASLGGYVTDGMDLDLYALGLTSAKTRGLPVDPEDPAAGTFTRSSATEITLGARALDRFAEVLDYRLEMGLQTGTRHDPATGGRSVRSALAYQADGELGVSPVGWLRVSGGGAFASGDDPGTERDEGWNELYPTGHRWLGLMDVVGARNNVISANAKVRALATESTALHLDAHYFRRVHAAEGAERELGSELDVYVVQKLGRAVAGRALYGVFLPTEGHYGVADPAHYAEVELRASF